MADKTQAVPENVDGMFYVDQTCIDCDFCRESAPGVFQRHVAGRYSFVAHQPQDAAEEAAARSALEGCPVEAIGDDGGTRPN
jgi:ferredoxin